jgi:steroid delta-isomerase-like uncharacterized protein
MSDQDNLRVARQVWDAWNAHDVDGVLKNLDEKHVWDSDTLPSPVVGRDSYRQAMQTYLTAFPDLRFSVDQMLPSGDYVVSRYTATGTHRGDLMGIAPTNRRAETRGCTIAEIKNGKIIRGWTYWDSGHLLRQLGVLPTS